MSVQFTHRFEDIIGVENLLEAWREFAKGKRHKRDVQEFSMGLMKHILTLHNELVNHTYQHGGYQAFRVHDPKPRDIHKAAVRDRLVHHAVYRVLYPFFDRTFIADSFSCRNDKGTHNAINRFRAHGYKVSKNNTKTCWVLKCDIVKFFANIDHEILRSMVRRKITDQQIVWLLDEIIGSFSSARPGVGLPLGNLTSQLLVNVYMNEFDQFVKHKLKARCYARYADDFVVFSDSYDWLERAIPLMQGFLDARLRLRLHEDKISIRTLNSGNDFLGWDHFFDHRVLRAATKRRMLRRLAANPLPETINSYLGLMSHGNTAKLKMRVLREISLESRSKIQ